ncbi:hypothetical protein BH20BAC1_BH20BAC1_06040 [soil metagenome]
MEGDWRIVYVDPKQKSFNGYMKIEPSGDKNVTIKSHIQFYYDTINDTLFLTILHAFAGCSSCDIEEVIKLKGEDVAIASQYYQIRKKYGIGGLDTLLNAGANKSIRAAMSLKFLNNKNCCH